MTPLANVSTWADKVRYTKAWHWTAPLHFIDVQDKTYKHGCHYVELPDNQIGKLKRKRSMKGMQTCEFIYERDCKNDFCVAGAIANYSTILDERYEVKLFDVNKERRLRGKDNRQADSAKNSTELVVDSLMFVTHFVGDIHQPLHCSRKSDKGGNSIKVHFDVPTEESYKWSLHSVWDTGIIVKSVQEMYNHSRDAFEDEILRMIDTDYKDEIRSWLECPDGRRKQCTSLWGQESFLDALKYSYRSEKGVEIVTDSTITNEYFVTRLPIVQNRLAAAGVRLAQTLELILGDGINVEH